jgi:hypothetical protein
VFVLSLSCADGRDVVRLDLPDDAVGSLLRMIREGARADLREQIDTQLAALPRDPSGKTPLSAACGQNVTAREERPMEPAPASASGAVVALERFGKAAFFKVGAREGWCYAKTDDVGAAALDVVQMGAVVAVEGVLITGKRGETLLAKRIGA